MLIIAMPKSASTSLLHAVGGLLGVPHMQMFPASVVENNRYQNLHELHSDVGMWPSMDLVTLQTSTHLFKQHIPPLAHNVRMVDPNGVLFLHRPPGDIIEAYRRAGAPLQAVDIDTLKYELEIFGYGWLNAGVRELSFSALMKDPAREVAWVASLLSGREIPEPFNFELPRYNYTRGQV